MHEWTETTRDLGYALVITYDITQKHLVVLLHCSCEKKKTKKTFQQQQPVFFWRARCIYTSSSWKLLYRMSHI